MKRRASVAALAAPRSLRKSTAPCNARPSSTPAAGVSPDAASGHESDRSAVRSESRRTLRRFADEDDRRRLAAAIARAREGEVPRSRTDDVSGSPVPPGQTTAGPTRRPGNLDEDYIRARIQEILPLARECYELALERAPDLEGTMTLDFVIDAEEGVGGDVSEARLAEDSGLLDPELAECMTETITSIEFQPPQGGGTVRVVYPLSFALDDTDDEPRRPR